MSLVSTAAQRFAHRREPVKDVLQVGVMGLIKAINGFDPRRGVEFVSYALPTITGEMKRLFRDTSWAVHVPRRPQELRLQLVKTGEALEHELGREPTRHELASRLGTTEQDVAEGLLAGDAYTAATPDTGLAGDDGEGGSALHRRLGAPDRDLENIVDLTALRQILPTLPEADQRILALRFADDLTRSEIGGRIGCSQMQVSRQLARILAELRTKLDDRSPHTVVVPSRQARGYPGRAWASREAVRSSWARDWTADTSGGRACRATANTWFTTREAPEPASTAAMSGHQAQQPG